MWSLLAARSISVHRSRGQRSGATGGLVRKQSFAQLNATNNKLQSVYPTNPYHDVQVRLTKCSIQSKVMIQKGNNKYPLLPHPNNNYSVMYKRQSWILKVKKCLLEVSHFFHRCTFLPTSSSLLLSMFPSPPSLSVLIVRSVHLWRLTPDTRTYIPLPEPLMPRPCQITAHLWENTSPWCDYLHVCMCVCVYMWGMCFKQRREKEKILLALTSLPETVDHPTQNWQGKSWEQRKQSFQRQPYSEGFCNCVVLYKYVSGRQINTLSPVGTLQHSEERKSNTNRALLVLFFFITVKLQKHEASEHSVPSQHMKSLPKLLLFLYFYIQNILFRTSVHTYRITYTTSGRSASQHRKKRTVTETECSPLSLPPIKHLSLPVPLLLLPLFHSSVLSYPHPPTVLIAAGIGSTGTSERRSALSVGAAWTGHVGGLQSDPALIRALHPGGKKIETPTSKNMQQQYLMFRLCLSSSTVK